jgi:hypothetical protein
VTGFKVPSSQEAAHDFLFRYHRAVSGALAHHPLESMKLRFPKPTVDIEEIRMKCHEIVKEEKHGEQDEVVVKQKRDGYRKARLQDQQPGDSPLVQITATADLKLQIVW